jgi:uncharacterized protein (TIGR02271 family)
MTGQDQNTRTLVAVFDDFNGAQRAAHELMNQGIPENSIEIHSNQRTGAAGYGGSAQAEHSEGGFSGWLHRLFGGDDDTRTTTNDSDDYRSGDDRTDDYRSETGHYSEALRRGGAVVSVTVPQTQVETAVNTLNENGAVDIDRRAESWRQQGYQGYDASAPAYTADQAATERSRYQTNQTDRTMDRPGSTAIPVIEEELQVGKRSVQRGGVRVYSKVVERPVEEQIRLREEHVRVERRPVNRPVSPEEAGRLRDQTIEVTEMAEEPVVSKQARVTEEVVVGKEATERTETVRDNVRRTEVRVDPIQGGTGSATSRTSAAGQTGAGVLDETHSGPAYDYGYRAANDARYRGRSWEDVEDDLRTDYLRNNPNSTWDRAKGEIR